MPASGSAARIDVLIRGAGPVGCALALALRQRGLSVALLDANAPQPLFRPAFRPLALSYASRLILQRIGVWPAVRATPIETILVSQSGAFGRMQLDAADARVPALGYVTDYASLYQALRSGLAFTKTAIDARCVVHAEGSAPDATEKRYAQHALVALVDTLPAAANTAFERFTPEGPLALLPWAGRYALIWSTRPERAAALAAAGEQDFLRTLAAAAGAKPGQPLRVEARAVQPLSLRVRATRVGPREVYIGNAAQTLHPVAGQGLNLGLRDAWQLAQTLSQASDPGAAATLAAYAAQRRLDAAATIRVTDWLARGFLGSSRLLSAGRGIALSALDVLPGPRRFFTRRMVYGPSALP